MRNYERYATLHIIGWIILMLIVAATLFWAAANDGKPVRPGVKPLQPLPEQVQASPKQLPSRSAEPEYAEPDYREVILEATAYSYTGSRTYTGTWPSRGTIAVDPDVIPLGTSLYVEGYGFGMAEDTGGLIKGNIVDVFFESEDACWKWGRRKVRVKVYE
jgi:3D (Asp-Asp-Asp) domain-containing protein